ncbi:hypothetical protein ACFSC4_13220 [Deinococcus malanensis]|uniref:hypothetical protein n=1 Tax=Deinococcus malanensis TaxID=1706855 RepID=UPI00363EBB15
MAWRLQRTAAQKVSAALQGTRAEQSTASYLNLVRATGWFTVVQDAPGTTLKVAQFGEALRQLTGGDTAALNQSLATLRAGTRALNATLVSPPDRRATPAAPAASPAQGAGTLPGQPALPIQPQPPTPRRPPCLQPLRRQTRRRATSRSSRRPPGLTAPTLH